MFGPAKSRESHFKSGAGKAEPERLPKVAMPFTLSDWSLAMREEPWRREMPSWRAARVVENVFTLHLVGFPYQHTCGPKRGESPHGHGDPGVTRFVAVNGAI